MKINVTIETEDNDVKVTAGKELRNYDGRPLKPGEVLMPMVLGEDFIKANVTNPDSIKWFTAGKSTRKVVLVAVPEEQASFARSQLNFVQNEDNGKYCKAGETPYDFTKGQYEDDVPDPLNSVEAFVEDKVLAAKATEMFGEYFNKLLEASPKHAYALLLIMNGVNGKEFMDMMKLGHECANVIRKEAEYLYSKGLEKIDLENIHSNRTKNTDYYKEAAEAALDHLLDFFA
ncbi:hypothetical protein [Butyrivibrio sp. AD3002]|uniref:hypothetical protein n=1 Tax=Butyrivibrio sp. AD3002 TaxID=1280670 RepID=UPI0003B55BEE|nr:hypothetical protein [Butyrivibrio sp. AD3002]